MAIWGFDDELGRRESQWGFAEDQRKTQWGFGEGEMAPVEPLPRIRIEKPDDPATSVATRLPGGKTARFLVDSDYRDEAWADFRRTRHRTANFVKTWLGESVARAGFGDEFIDSLPPEGVPEEYLGARKTQDGWVDAYGYPIEDPRQNLAARHGEIRAPEEGFLNIKTWFPHIADPDWWLGRIQTGDTEELVKGVIDDLWMMPSREAFRTYMRILNEPDEVTALEKITTGVDMALSPLDQAAWGGMAGKLARPLERKALQHLVRNRLGKSQMASDEIADVLYNKINTNRQEAVARVKALSKMGLALPRFLKNTVYESFPKALRPEWYLESAWEKVLVPASHKRVFLFGMGDEGAKSIAEIMQPAVERLEKVKRGKGTLASPFRNAQAQRAILDRAGGETASIIGRMGPKARHQLLRASRGLDTSRNIQELLRSQTKGFGLRKSYEKAFLDQVDKTFRKRIAPDLSDEDLLGLPSVDKFLTDIERGMTEGTSERQIQKLLKGAIEDDTLPWQIRAHARDLYNMPIDTPLAVSEAAKNAANSFLTSSLKRLGVVRPYLNKADDPNEYLVSQFPGIAGAYVPRDVELELRTMQKIPKLAHGMFNKWFLTPWKTNKVILRPATHFRNTISNVILNDWGGLPFYRADVYIDAAREMKSQGKLWKEWMKLTGGGGSFTLNEIDQMSRGLRYPSNMLEHTLALYDTVVAPARKLYNAEEQWAKMAKFMWNRKHGMDPREAALDAMKWTFNYGEITRFTGRMRASAAPFFTWQAKVVPLMAETMFKHPWRMAKWPAFYMGLQANALNQLKLSDDEWDYIEKILPEYVKEGQFLLMPWRDDQDRLQLLNLTYMIPGFGDIGEMYTNPSGWMLGHPLLSIGSALLSKRTFGGAPLYHEWEDNSTKFMKAMGYAWQQFWPSWLPGPKLDGAVMAGTDWKRIYDMIENDPEALTWEQMAASQVGFQIKPVDKAVAARKHRALTNIHLSELGAEMKKELRRANSPQARRRVIEKFIRLRKEVLGLD